MIRKNNLNTIIRNRRIRLGLTQHDLASACGMTKHEYRDLEDYDDEVYTVVRLAEIECVCSRIGIKLVDLFALTSNGKQLPIDIICRRMEEKNISTKKLSDLIGIEESYIDSIKEDIVKIGGWVMDPVISLSSYLELNLGSLLNSFVEYRQEEKRGK
jgi:transcriptional regulator with XRE-family HTH domain